jgi:hypothetical protein
MIIIILAVIVIVIVEPIAILAHTCALGFNEKIIIIRLSIR